MPVPPTVVIFNLTHINFVVLNEIFPRQVITSCNKNVCKWNGSKLIDGSILPNPDILTRTILKIVEIFFFQMLAFYQMRGSPYLDTLLLQSQGPGEDVDLVSLQLVVLRGDPGERDTVKTGVGPARPT